MSQSYLNWPCVYERSSQTYSIRATSKCDRLKRHCTSLRQRLTAGDGSVCLPGPPPVDGTDMFTSLGRHWRIPGSAHWKRSNAAAGGVFRDDWAGRCKLTIIALPYWCDYVSVDDQHSLRFDSPGVSFAFLGISHNNLIWQTAKSTSNESIIELWFVVEAGNRSPLLVLLYVSGGRCTRRRRMWCSFRY